MRVPSSLLVCTLLISLSCISVTSYQLPLSGLQARSTFPRLAACARARGLLTVEQPESLSVRFDLSALIQYVIQEEQYSMVVTVDSGVPDSERASRAAAAKTAGDEIFVCSAQSGAVLTPGGAGGLPTTTAANGSICVGATSPSCRQDGDCESQNCTGAVCQSRVFGSPCGGVDEHCDSRNCTSFCCQSRTLGSLCGARDQHCDSLNCTDGRCQPRTVGSPCGSQDEHCDSLNCTYGRCQPRTTGAPCGTRDGHCDSFRCVNGHCG